MTSKKPLSLEKQLKLLQSLAVEQGLRLTALRLKVLGVLAQSSIPLGAYDIRAHINLRRSKMVEPASVYRCLDYLMNYDWVIKVGSTNRFMLCTHIMNCTCHRATHPQSHAHVLLVCQGCGHTQETHDTSAMRKLNACAHELGFIPKQHVLEMHGLCQACHA